MGHGARGRLSIQLLTVRSAGQPMCSCAGSIRNTTSRSLILKYTHLFDVFR